MKVYVCSSCLWHLVFSSYSIMFVVLYKIRTCLFESKGDTAFYAILSDLHYPIEITRAGVVAGLSTGNHKFYPFSQPGFQINRFQYQLTNDAFVLYREFAKHGYVVIAFSPIWRLALCIRLVTNTKRTSGRNFIISHASCLQPSASSMKKSDVKHVHKVVPAGTLNVPSFRLTTGRRKHFVLCTKDLSMPCFSSCLNT